MKKRAGILANQVIDWYDRSRIYLGGGERYTLDLSRLLVKLGYHVDIFQPAMRNFDPVKFEDGIDIYFIKPDTTWFNYKLICDEFYRRTASFNIHIVTVPEFLSGPVHDNTILTAQGFAWLCKDVGDLTSYDKSMLKAFFRKPAKVVFIHDYIRRLTEDLGFVGEDRSVVIDHGIDINEFSPPTKDRKKIILFPGRAETVKGVEHYKELVEMQKFFVESGLPEGKILDGWEYVWCGEGSRQDELDKRISRKHEEMASLYKEISICCVLNCWSSGIINSLTLLEAMSSGVPCIVFDGVQDAVINKVNGFTVKKDSNAIQETIIRLISSKTLRDTIGANARETVVSRYNKERWDSEWETVIKECTHD